MSLISAALPTIANALNLNAGGGATKPKLGSSMDAPHSKVSSRPDEPVAGSNMRDLLQMILGFAQQQHGDQMQFDRDLAFGRRLPASGNSMTPQKDWNSMFSTGGRGKEPGINNPGSAFSWEVPYTTPKAPGAPPLTVNRPDYSQRPDVSGLVGTPMPDGNVWNQGRPGRRTGQGFRFL